MLTAIKRGLEGVEREEVKKEGVMEEERDGWMEEEVNGGMELVIKDGVREEVVLC